MIEDNRYLPLNAENVLAKFMVNGWPDETLFIETIKIIMRMARKSNRRIRAFGEMVAILWAQGHSGATVQLEHYGIKSARKNRYAFFAHTLRAVLPEI